MSRGSAAISALTPTILILHSSQVDGSYTFFPFSESPANSSPPYPLPSPIAPLQLSPHAQICGPGRACQMLSATGLWGNVHHPSRCPSVATSSPARASRAAPRVRPLAPRHLTRACGVGARATLHPRNSDSESRSKAPSPSRGPGGGAGWRAPAMPGAAGALSEARAAGALRPCRSRRARARTRFRAGPSEYPSESPPAAPMRPARGHGRAARRRPGGRSCPRLLRGALARPRQSPRDSPRESSGSFGSATSGFLGRESPTEPARSRTAGLMRV